MSWLAFFVCRPPDTSPCILQYCPHGTSLMGRSPRNPEFKWSYQNRIVSRRGHPLSSKALITKTETRDDVSAQEHSRFCGLQVARSLKPKSTRKTNKPRTTWVRKNHRSNSCQSRKRAKLEPPGKQNN